MKIFGHFQYYAVDSTNGWKGWGLSFCNTLWAEEETSQTDLILFMSFLSLKNMFMYTEKETEQRALIGHTLLSRHIVIKNLYEGILTFSVPISKIASLLMSSGVNGSYAILLFFQGMLLPLVRVLIVEQQRDSSLSVTTLLSQRQKC